MSTTPRIMKRHVAAQNQSHSIYNFEDIQARCEAYKEQVKNECRNLILKATQEGDEIYKKAQTDGYSEGHQQGMQQAEQEIVQRSQKQAEDMVEQRLGTVLPAISELLDQIVAARSQCQAEWERELVDLSTGIAGKIIRRNLELNPDIVINGIREIVQLATGHTSLELRLNSGDLEALGDRVRQAVLESARGIEVRLIGDDSITPGGCIVTTDHGQVDAQIETMLTQISDELLDGIHE